MYFIKMRLVLFLFTLFHFIQYVDSCTCGGKYNNCDCDGGQYAHKLSWLNRECRNCPAGRWKSTCSALTSCYLCSAGKISGEGATSCTTSCQPLEEPQLEGVASATGATECVDKSANQQCEYKQDDWKCFHPNDLCEDGQRYNTLNQCQDCGSYATDYYADKRWSTLVKYSDNGNVHDTVPKCKKCPSGKTTSGKTRALLEDCQFPTCDAGEYKTSSGCATCSAGTYQDENEHEHATCKICAANKQTQTTTTFGTYVSEGATECVNCPTGMGSIAGGQCTQCAADSDFGTADGEGCKTYTQKYLTGNKPTNMKSIPSQNTAWKSLSSTKQKRSGFREMIKWIRTQFTNRKAKMNKEDLILSTTFKTRMGARADVEVFNPKKDGNCDVDVKQQPDSFDVTLTDVGDTGIVCKGTTKISKLELTAVNDESNTYKYYCHDGSGWGTGVSITSGGSYSCDGRKFHVN